DMDGRRQMEPMIIGIVTTDGPDSADWDPGAVPALFPHPGDGGDDASAHVKPIVQAWSAGGTPQIGGAQDVAAIRAASAPGKPIKWALPPIFEANATVVVPDSQLGKKLSDAVLLALLQKHSADQPWWLGYLETGASDVVFPDASRVQCYTGWDYVLVQ